MRKILTIERLNGDVALHCSLYKQTFHHTPPPEHAITIHSSLLSSYFNKNTVLIKTAKLVNQNQDMASSSSAFHPKSYDVFISFRGEDTRSNFTSHLRDALRGKQIETYMDDRLERGDEISPALSKAIEESLISVVVFSQNYASSKWCLDELVKILECRNMGQDVIPVFYNVDPSHVRKQIGSYKEAFAKHERDLKCDKERERLNKWKKALVDAANIAGWDSQAHRDDSNLIQMIVKDVLRKLEYKYPPQESKCPFGINENLAPIESLLREVRTIGIWGMGGIGKTTIAKWLFDKYSSQYEGSFFLANMREKSGMDAQALCNEVVSKLLGESERTNIVGRTFVKTRLSCKKIFLVLDDASNSRQLKDLVEKLELQNFESSSRVIITSRDNHVLTNGGVDKIHKVEELNPQDSLQLFSLNAFRQKLPREGYEELSKRAVDYAKGVPLALEVLGSFLHSKSENEWESALTKLKKIPNKEIQGVLRLSYDGLDDEEREMFLDIACFLKGDDVGHVISLLDSYDFYAGIGLRTLLDKALITIKDKVVWMHDLIQEMGWEIVREESIKEPGRRSRLWDPKEVYDVLKYKRGTEKIEGISLDMSEIRDLQLSAETFQKMINLRFLKFYSRCIKYSRVHLPSDLQLFSDKLRYLEWNGCLSKSLPLTFCPENLVELVMPNSHFMKLWDREEEHDFVNLKRIDLHGSKQLMELPNFCKASQLENVDLSYCESLCQVHPSLLSLHKLVTLHLTGCKKLESLESDVHLISLRDLKVDGCSSLQKFSLSSEAMRELDLSGTRIDILHSSIARFSKLQSLRLCRLRLENLPDELSCLRNLEKLVISYCPGLEIHKEKLHLIFDGLQSLKLFYLSHCSYISELPDNISVLSSLIRLDLSGSNIECLPASIKELTELRFLTLSDCKRLRSLPELPKSIVELEASNCTLLETVTTRTLRLQKEMRVLSVNFENCVKLNEQAVSSILKDTFVSIKQCLCDIKDGARGDAYRLHICFPASTVAECFQFILTRRPSITMGFHPCLQIVGFVFCLVLSPLLPNPGALHFIILHQNNDTSIKHICGAVGELTSDHAYLWCSLSYPSARPPSEISFNFVVETQIAGEPQPPDQFIRIKECGVCPILVHREDCSHAPVPSKRR